jgi:hypothetical protein
MIDNDESVCARPLASLSPQQLSYCRRPSSSVLFLEAVLYPLGWRWPWPPRHRAKKNTHTRYNTIEHNRIIWTMCVLARAQGKKRNKKTQIKKNGRTTAIFRRSSSNITLNIIGSFLFFFLPVFISIFCCCFFLIRHLTRNCKTEDLRHVSMFQFYDIVQQFHSVCFTMIFVKNLFFCLVPLFESKCSVGSHATCIKSQKKKGRENTERDDGWWTNGESHHGKISARKNEMKMKIKETQRN